MTDPIELTSYYMTPQHGIGQSMSLEAIGRELESLALGPVLVLLAQIAYRADSAVRDRVKQAELIRNLFPHEVVPVAIDRLRRDPNVVPLSSQVAMNLATRALVHCSDDDHEHVMTDDLARQLGGLLLGLAEHTSRGEPDDDSLKVELARLDLYFRLKDSSGWYDVANDLLFEVLPTMTADRDWVDADAVIRDAYGMDLELFWALTLGLGTMAANTEYGFDLPASVESNNLSASDIGAWMRAWSSELSDARERARVDVASESWWSFTALYDRPILKLAEHRGIAVRPAFLANKATPAGMFWAVRDAFVASGGAHQRWAQLFGRAVEATGRRYALELLSGVPMLRDEDEIRARWGPGRACDLVLLGDAWVAIDFVHHQITKAAATTGNLGDLIRDASFAAVDKLARQIDETLRRGLDAEAEPPDAIYPMVVIGNPFPLNPVFFADIERLIAARSPAVIGVHPICRPPAILELHEFSALLQVAAATRSNVSTILDSWLSSPLGRNNFRNWLVTDGPGHVLRDNAGTPRWQQRSLGRMFGSRSAE